MIILSITSFDYLLPFSAFFLGLWGCTWSLSVARKRKKESGDITPIVTVSEQFKQRAHTTLANAAKIGLGIVLGIVLTELWQLHHAGFIGDAVVDVQNGSYLVWHYRDDQRRPHKRYGNYLCDGPNMPHFEVGQIIQEMHYTRRFIDGHECEDFTAPSTSFSVVRVNGVPILEKGDD